MSSGDKIRVEVWVNDKLACERTIFKKAGLDGGEVCDTVSEAVATLLEPVPLVGFEL